MYYKKGRFIINWNKYYKLGQGLLQSWAGNSIQSVSVVIAKYGKVTLLQSGATITEKTSISS